MFTINVTGYFSQANISSFAPSIIPEFSVLLRVVCRHFNVSSDLVLSKSKICNVVLARQVLIYIAHSVLTEKKSLIALAVKRDYHTVSHSINKVDEMMSVDKELKQIIIDLTKLIKEML